LTWFLAHHLKRTSALTGKVRMKLLTDALRVDQAECIDNDLALDGLDGIDDDSYAARV